METQTNADSGSTRNAIRWGLLLAAIGTVGFRLPRLVGEVRQWREALRFGDASGAESWHRNLMVDAVAALIVLVFGVGLFYALRQRAKAAQ